MKQASEAPSIEKKVIISLATIVVASRCVEEGLAFDKDLEKRITYKALDIMLYGGPCPVTNNKKVMTSFVRTPNLI